MIFDRYFPQYVDVDDDYQEIRQYIELEDFMENTFIRVFISLPNFGRLVVKRTNAMVDYNYVLMAERTDKDEPYILGFINENQFDFDEI